MAEKEKKKKKLFGLFGEEEKPSKEELLEKAKKDNPLIKKEPLDPKNGIKRHLVIVESMTSGLEKYYFQVLRTLREPKFHGLEFEKVIKVHDLFDASVTSSFHGQVGTKISAMQQQAQQQLATIGGMLKTLFPIVREIRIMDERLDYYKRSLDGDENAEIALKSIWIETVEQGMQNPNSVYSLSNKVGYLTLPDLFFRINPKDGLKGLDDTIKSMKKEGAVPLRVIDVVTKKLFSYYNWKEKTYNEMQHTWKFRVKYLRQHYNSIKLYMSWVKPYLRSIQQLQMKGDYNDADLVNAFETSKIQLELLAQKKGKNKKYITVVLAKFNYVTRPELTYTPQGQKQASHAGRLELEIEAYAVTEEQIELYLAQKDGEDIDLLASIDSTMNELKDDLKKYLVAAGEAFKEDEIPVPKPKKESMIEPFMAMGAGFKDLFAFARPPQGFLKGPSRQTLKGEEREKKSAGEEAQFKAWLLYDIFKKVNKFYTPI